MEPVFIESPDEVLLKELCYMATGIQEFHVGPDGETFTLGCSDATLKVPPGALKKETSVHFAIILHGPFVLSAGYKLDCCGGLRQPGWSHSGEASLP